jgi:hypothetical protein
MNYIKKGGVILRDRTANPNQTLMGFINACRRVKILTDHSVSCVTYIFYDLPAGYESPYIRIKSNNFEEPVESILVKIGFVSNDPINPQNLMCLRSRGQAAYGGRMQAVTQYELKREVEMQDYLFKKRFKDPVTPFEPICPAIIGYT